MSSCTSANRVAGLRNLAVSIAAGLSFSAQSAETLLELTDFAPQSMPEIRQITVAGNVAFFSAYAPGETAETLWVTDGTVAGTRVLGQSLGGGALPTSIQEITPFQGGVVFRGADGNGVELWSSDGTPDGTVEVFEIYPGVGGNPQFITVLGDEIFFAARDAQSGTELWRSDGTAQGTSLFTDLNVSGDSFPGELTASSDRLFFVAETDFEYVWVSDGTAAGTRSLVNIKSGGTANIDLMTPFGAGVVFAANDGTVASETSPKGGSTNFELWMSDGTSEGTQKIVELNPTDSAEPEQLVVNGSSAFFVATDGQTGMELYRSDGTAAGTVQLTNILDEPDSNVDEVTAFANGVFFEASEPSAPKRAGPDPETSLWFSDGTVAGTVEVADTVPDGNDRLEYFASSGRRLYFAARDSAEGIELWSSGGTAASTARLSDIAPGTADSSPKRMTAFGSGVLFAANDASGQSNLWYGVAPDISLSTDSPRVSEGGSVPLSLTLTAAPDAGTQVNLLLTPTDSACSVSPSAVAFSDANWNLSTIVTLSGVPDTVPENTRECTIEVTAASATTDPDYAGSGFRPIAVTVEEPVLFEDGFESLVDF